MSKRTHELSAQSRKLGACKECEGELQSFQLMCVNSQGHLLARDGADVRMCPECAQCLVCCRSAEECIIALSDDDGFACTECVEWCALCSAFHFECEFQEAEDGEGQQVCRKQCCMCTRAPTHSVRDGARLYCAQCVGADNWHPEEYTWYTSEKRDELDREALELVELKAKDGPKEL